MVVVSIPIDIDIHRCNLSFHDELVNWCTKLYRGGEREEGRGKGGGKGGGREEGRVLGQREEGRGGGQREEGGGRGGSCS